MPHSVRGRSLGKCIPCSRLHLVSFYPNRTLARWLECSAMARETWVQSQVESYQRLKKWYLMPHCLTLSIIRYGSRIKWSDPRKRVTSPPTVWCSSYRKGSLRVILDYGRQLYFLLTYNSTTSFSDFPRSTIEWDYPETDCAGVDKYTEKNYGNFELIIQISLFILDVIANVSVVVFSSLVQVLS